MSSENPYDVVILDLSVPGGMGGEEAIQELKAIDPEVKAIIFSGYTNSPVMTDFSKYGFHDSIAKPYIIHELQRALDRIVQTSHKLRLIIRLESMPLHQYIDKAIVKPSFVLR